MDAKQLFAAGNLTAAIEAVTKDVKAKPADPALRTLLFELLAFAGQLDRSAKQLEVVSLQDEQVGWATQVYVNLLHAEGLRRRLFSEGLKPGFLLDPPAWVDHHLQAINRLRQNQPQEAQALLDQSAEQRSTCPGTMGEQTFDNFRDGDDILAPILELVLIRDYIWLPLEQVRELEISKPERPRDLIWTPVRIVTTDGTQRRAYMPALYVGSHEHPDDQVKLGRMTDWRGDEGGPVQGIGQREFFLGQEPHAMLELKPVTFSDTAETAS